MKQLEFEDLDAKKTFENMIEDALLYCSTASTVGKCVLREVKSRGRSTMSAKAFIHILLSTSDALCDYAYQIASAQGINVAREVTGTESAGPSKIATWKMRAEDREENAAEVVA